MGRSQKGIARPEAGAHDAETAVALGFEPIETATDIDDGLAAGVQGAADIGGDRVVGAPDLRRRANVVVRHAQPQYRNSQSD